MKKVILASKFLLFNQNNEFQEKNIQEIQNIYQEGIKLYILARQQTIQILKRNLPRKYEGKVNFLGRKEIPINDMRDMVRQGTLVSMIGIVDEDAQYAFNAHLPLFNPRNLLDQEVQEDSLVDVYGLPINSLNDIIHCYKAYEIGRSVYFQLNFETMTVLSLNSANSLIGNDIEKEIKQIFHRSLKVEEPSWHNQTLLLLYFNLIYEILTNVVFRDVDYWGVFPSSSFERTNTSITWLKEAVRALVKGKPFRKKGYQETPLFIRTKSVIPKKDDNQRIKNKCENDFESLIVNPELKDKLKGKKVCVIDDYITNGYSAESAKHLLESAGVSELVFVSIGKYGFKYYETNYQIFGDVFTDNYQADYQNEILHDNRRNYNLERNIDILEFEQLLDIENNQNLK